ncbi:MAG: SDR family NAD(P)-dependent oxidoreductase [Cyclobacteriaceae bacterium]|nr:SDR family NAD(P)-dependent oxidoreductase [Cyclobacteriaceae bacterium]
MRLTNNTILITGGTSGIGLALGRSLLGLGNKVVVLGRNEKKLNDVKKEGFETICCDLGDINDINKAVSWIKKTFPNVNMLFNNAGIQNNYDFTNSIVDPESIVKEINTNLTGQMILTHLLMPLLYNAKKACIINTTSALGAFAKPDALVYSATKSAMRNFTRGLRYRLRNSPIRVLELIPPVTDTGMTRGRNGYKMPVELFIKKILPRLKKERHVITTPRIRMFLLIAFLAPSLAHKILTKGTNKP